MRKIPTLFVRGADFGVTAKAKAECQWVLDGEGVPTEKLDGTNVRLTVRSGAVVRVEKRRNPSKAQKKRGIVDAWYADASADDPADQHVMAAVAATATIGWPDGEHVCEAVGPKIQGNPLQLAVPVCVRLADMPRYPWPVSRDYARLRHWLLEAADSIYAPGVPPEGIVFHHPDGRMAKIKRTDFR